MSVFFTQSGGAWYGRLFDAVATGGPASATLVYGGKLKREYGQSLAVRRILLRMDQSGRAKQLPDNIVDAEETALLRAGVGVSDDQHVLALARKSAARLLCSHD